jgi:hypothetical protein
MGGAGMGFSFVPVTIASLSGVNRSDAGVASGLVNTSRQIGGAIGLAAVSAIAAASTSAFADEHGVSASSASALDHGFRTGLYVLTALLVLGRSSRAAGVKSSTACLGLSTRAASYTVIRPFACSRPWRTAWFDNGARLGCRGHLPAPVAV